MLQSLGCWWHAQGKQPTSNLLGSACYLINTNFSRFTRPKFAGSAPAACSPALHLSDTICSLH